MIGSGTPIAHKSIERISASSLNTWSAQARPHCLFRNTQSPEDAVVSGTVRARTRPMQGAWERVHGLGDDCSLDLVDGAPRACAPAHRRAAEDAEGQLRDGSELRALRRLLRPAR